MAKRDENECAYCAEELKTDPPIIGQDWKVYCSAACAQHGEVLSRAELSQLMQHICDQHLPLAA